MSIEGIKASFENIKKWENQLKHVEQVAELWDLSNDFKVYINKANQHIKEKVNFKDGLLCGKIENNQANIKYIQTYDLLISQHISLCNHILYKIYDLIKEYKLVNINSIENYNKYLFDNFNIEPQKLDELSILNNK